MKHSSEQLYEKYEHFKDKLKDEELDEFLLGLAGRLEDAEAMYHQLAYLLRHVRAAVAYPVRPKHLQDAIARAEQLIKRSEGTE